MMRAIGMLMLLALVPVTAGAEETFTVTRRLVSDDKSVFATVESTSVLSARSRIAGTVAEIRIDEGDRVERGQAIAAVGDEKLALRITVLDAQIAALEAEARQLRANLERAEGLFAAGTIPKVRRDEARTAAEVAAGQLAARMADRQVARQQMAEGEVLAPAGGRVLAVPVTAGSVVLAGEVVASIAEENYVLRLRLPERHARFLAIGDAVRLDSGEAGPVAARTGVIRLIYPQIEDGRVVADAAVDGLGDYFVGQRLRVWVSGGQRSVYVVPAGFVTTRAGVDYVHVRAAGGGTLPVPVQLGRALVQPGLTDGVEILSGLADGDTLVRP
ncbi:MAG: efflux RND transporter periplasmic adaptor subunit [Alphaproteobacteria bacterium]